MERCLCDPPANATQIAHVAIWTADLERLKAFYESYFGAAAGPRYANPRRGFASYLLVFASGARLELMSQADLAVRGGDRTPAQGLAHAAFSVASEAAVDALTARLRADGYAVVGEPRRTGDGYYESSVLDPDGNQIEIAA